MKNEACLILIKPDGLVKSLTGNIITQLSKTELKIIGSKVVRVTEELAEKHYEGLKEKKGEKLYGEILKYITGEYHTKRVLALVYYGDNAIDKIRKLAGCTNPEEADPTTIRGQYGRIHSKTCVMENVMHASDSNKSAKKEIKLWFKPEELTEEIYPSKTVKQESEIKVWE
jgi:nucleoside-diphosphate kinase